jgi:regulatory protein
MKRKKRPLRKRVNQRLKGSPADTRQTRSPLNARQYALKLLSYRPRSEKEMVQRLKIKGFDEEQIKQTLNFLHRAELIKDEQLASELLKTSIENKHLGKKGVAMFLTKRGIKKDIIDKTTLTISDDDEKKTALIFVEKKLHTLKRYPPMTIKRRLCGMLQRRGFSYDTINTVLRTIKMDNE